MQDLASIGHFETLFSLMMIVGKNGVKISHPGNLKASTIDQAQTPLVSG